MKALCVVLIALLPAQGAITFFGSAASPADNGSQVGPTIAVTPPASMADGDLVFVMVLYKGTVTASVSNAGGQSWNSGTNRQGSGLTSRSFWCRFNGTWSANPGFTVTTGALGMSAIMLVFRPTAGANTWAIDTAESYVAYAAPSTPFTVTVTGQTTANSNTVTVASWLSEDDNTWGTLTGTGWTALATAQFRNQAGSDHSLSFAYKIQTAAGATGNVSQNQATLGGDAGITEIVTLYESAPPATTGTGWMGARGWF